MKKKNILSGYTKVDKEQLIGQTLTVVDLIKLNTENGEAVAVIFDDNTFTYLPTADLDYIRNEIMPNEEYMEEIHSGYAVIIEKKTSKNGRTYYVMFD